MSNSIIKPLASPKEINTLKKPVFVYFLAISLIVSPIGNIFISYMSGRTYQWYETDVILDLLTAIPVLEWVWLALLTMSGVMLFFQHKFAWAFAAISLLLVLGINTYKFIFMWGLQKDNSFLIYSQLVISAISLLSVLLVIFYSRYPYLDRRDTWFGQAAKRFDLVFKAKIMDEEGIEGIVESISTSGMRIHMSKRVEEKYQHSQILVFALTDCFFDKVTTKVVESKGSTLRLRFLNFSKLDKKNFFDWLEKKNQTS